MNENSMQAVLVKETGPKGHWNELILERVPRPPLHPCEVLVQVEACSVNRADLLQRRGLYPPPPRASSIMGLDFAGFVVGTGEDVEEYHPGDRVFGIVAGGGYGRYVAVPSVHCVSIPDNLSFVEAAATAEVFFTAYVNLFIEAGIQAGETLLVHGGGSGVGTASIQLAKAAGISTMITAGASDTIQRCLELGAAHGINYKEEDFAERVMAITKDEGLDVILDIMGAPYLSRHLAILKSRGRLVIIGLMGGNKTEVHLAPLLTKRIRIIGSVLRSRSNEEKAALAQSFTESVRPLLASGRVKPVVDRVFPIHAAEAAHRYMKDERRFGKVVLTWQSEED